MVCSFAIASACGSGPPLIVAITYQAMRARQQLASAVARPFRHRRGSWFFANARFRTQLSLSPNEGRKHHTHSIFFTEPFL